MQRHRAGAPGRARCGRCAGTPRAPPAAARAPRLQRRIDPRGLARLRGAEVELGGQHRAQPVVHRAAERGHHDRHRRHQREAGDDRRQAHHRLPRRAAQLRQREREGNVRSAFSFSKTNPETKGIRKMPPSSRQAIDSVAGDRNAVHRLRTAEERAQAQCNSNPGQTVTARANMRCSSPALSACAGAARAASSAGSSAPASATAMPREHVGERGAPAENASSRRHAAEHARAQVRAARCAPPTAASA